MSDRIIDLRAKSRANNNYFVMANEQMPDAVIALQQGETPIFSIGDISCIVGLPKARKTFLLACLVTAYLKEGGFMGLTTELTEKRVLICDTEQSRRFVWILIRRIYRLMDWNFDDKHNELLNILSLREFRPADRYDIIKKEIERLKPNLVLIDGFSDLIGDTNSLEESALMVGNLMALSSIKYCHICSVLHSNPNSDKARGHAGSELQRKSETVMLVQKDDFQTIVKPQFCRNMEFGEFAFFVNDVGLPEQCSYTPTVKQGANLNLFFEEIFCYAEFLSYSDLTDQVMKKNDIQERAAQNRIKKAVEREVIYKDVRGFYRLYIKENKREMEDNEGQESPF